MFLCLSPLATSQLSVFNSFSQTLARPSLQASAFVYLELSEATGDSAQHIGEGSLGFFTLKPKSSRIGPFWKMAPYTELNLSALILFPTY